MRWRMLPQPATGHVEPRSLADVVGATIGGDRLVALLDEQLAVAHVLRAAEDQRRLLVEVGGRQIEDATLAVARRATRLLGDERERRGLVEQAQLALRVLLVGRIEEDPAVEQIAMEVRDQ